MKTSEAVRIDARHARRDALFLAVVTVLSVVTYVGGLGLYSDDWAFLSVLHGVEDPTLPNLIGSLYEELSTRPMQAYLLASLYWLFELDPLGYHIINSAILCATIVVFYAALRQAGLPRVFALTVPLVFALLPHYSTDRFWIAAFQANLSMGFYFLSLFAHLKSLEATGSAKWAWVIGGFAAVLGSVFAYEVVAPLFLVSVVIILFRAGVRPRSIGPPEKVPRITYLIAILNLIGPLLAAAYKLTTTERAGVLGGLGTYIWNVKRTIRGSITVNFGDGVLELPSRAVRAVSSYADVSTMLVALVLGALIVGYLLWSLSAERLRRYRRGLWLLMIGCGLVVFGLGYAISLVTFDIGFSSTGMNNRTAIAAAIGVATMLVGMTGLLSSLLPTARLQHIAFSGITAIWCVAGFMVIDAAAGFWIEAHRAQQGIIASIPAEELPRDGVLLLDGVCPYVGPGTVFETNWDVSGMLQIEFDESLQGDVIKGNTQVVEDGIRTQIYDDVIHIYPFGDRLFIYHVGEERLVNLTSLDEARQYFAVHEFVDGDDGCPGGIEGRGAPIF